MAEELRAKLPDEGLNKDRISRYELGKNEVSNDMLKAYSEIFGTPVDWFFHRDVQPKVAAQVLPLRDQIDRLTVGDKEKTLIRNYLLKIRENPLYKDHLENQASILADMVDVQEVKKSS